ncbi:Hypothetical protein NCS54_00980800 [Fusarium falciforme]|uniref:Hypothetical protein n=1 Tax=Fusarium falciforme TaxID=195108 RepID=UPI002301DD18|nr:Hypothetical protein NCS54_00980800 [Fusarium falciforme]WAO92305.1 Hypothetical protein NCS54_00980800 [Fusarium falciforme]
MASTVALVDEKGLDRTPTDGTAGSSGKGPSDTLPNNDSGNNRGWLFPALETVSSYIPIPKASSLTSWYSTEGKQRSDDIDRWLEAEGIRSQRCFRAILLGDRDQTQTFWKQSRLLSEPLSEEEQQSLRSEVRRVFLEQFWNHLTERIDRLEKKRQNSEADEPTSNLLEILQQTLETQDGESDTAQAERLISMCQDSDFQEAFQQERNILEEKDGELLGIEQPKISTCTCGADSFTLSQLQRVFSPNYQATEHDWFHFDHRFPSMVRETQVNMTDYSLAITDVLMNSCRRSRWLHLYDDCACMLFVADISRYWIRVEDVMDYENYDLLKGTILTFESIANSERLSKKPLHLVLSNITAFKAQLTIHPLVDSFPEYTGTSDEEAIQFVVKEFLAVVKKRDVINVSTSDITALTGIGKVLDDLEKTVLKPLVEELADQSVSLAG